MKKARLYPMTLAAFYGSPWAILSAKLDEIESAMLSIVLNRSRDGWKSSDDEFDDIEEPVSRSVGDVAVIPISGTISPRPSAFTSGGSSAEKMGANIDKAKANPAVKNILLDIDSPGGSVFGIEELAGKIRQAAAVKPVHAVANHMAASAAYWLGSQATSFAVAPSGQVGSIGVIYRRTDRTASLEKDGVKVKYVTSGEFKGEGNPDMPMTDAELGDLQAKSDAYFDKFVNAVAAGRRQTAAHVRATYGNGRMFLAEEAKALGMVDRVATFETVLGELRAKTTRGRMAAVAGLSVPSA